MATVYLAEDLAHHGTVALEAWCPELGALLVGERFLKQVEVTAKLQHPQILPLHDSGDAGSFFLTALSEGCPSRETQSSLL